MKIRVLLGACLLSLLSGSVGALGLGEILVNSRLNQPLNAEIVVRESAPGEAERLVAKLASQEDFARVGLERARMPVTLRFETAKNARGQTIIKITSDEPVREPFLTLLVEANWSGGRLLREYGLLLDPAVTAPASRIVRTPAATPQPTPATPATPAATEARPAPPPVATTRPVPEQQAPVPATPAPVQSPAPAAAPAPRPAPPPTGFVAAPAQPAAPPSAPPTQALDGSYAVQRGDTLSGIARIAAADAGVTTNQMMLALQRENPKAFFADNINALKAGAVLRIPEADDLRAVSNADARAEVRRQIDTWTGVASAAPAAPAASLADAGAAPSTTIRPEQKPAAESRLELVPPGSDASGSEAAGRPGSGQGGVDVAQTQTELQRTREELRSRSDEVSELNSRVRDLEELNAKNARLLELKNTEVAELQRRLADAQGAEAASAPAAETAATAAQATTDSEPEATAATANASPTAEATEQTEGTASSSADTAATASDEGTLPAADDPIDAAAADMIAAVGNEASAETAAADGDAASPKPAGEEMSDAEWEAAATAGSNDPFAEDSPAPSSAGDTWTPGEPAAPATAVPADGSSSAASNAAPVAATAQPASPAPATEPWYKQPLVQGAGLIGLALLLLLALLARRQGRKAAQAQDETPKRSVSELFADTPTALTGAAAATTLSREEIDDVADLERQIAADPDNFGAYLELLSIHYANRDRDSFETWAERFYERPDSEASAEWDQVCGMGEELLPDHPLFDQTVEEDAVDNIEEDVIADRWSEPLPPPVEETPLPPVVQGQDVDVREMSDVEFDTFTANSAPEDDARPIEFTLDDLDDAPRAVSPVVRGVVLDESEPLPSDHLPPLSFETSVDDFVSETRTHVSESADVDAGAASDHEGGLDDAATKLELARAYLDMGDPEGARAMLEEVLGEGDAGQRAEARRLLAML